MKKLITTVLCLSIVLIMCLGLLCACNDDNFRNERNGNPQTGEFYSVQEAYDNGWISKGDLRNMAYYLHGDKQGIGFKPTPKNPAELSTETELAIKQARVNSLKKNSRFEDANVEDVFIHKYFGTYDGMVAVVMGDIYTAYPEVMYYETIGGIKFTYGNPNTIVLWAEYEFNNVYHATLYDRAIDWVKFDEERGARWSNNKDTILITDEETFNNNFSEFPVEVDFENQMVCGFLVVWMTNGNDYEIISTKVTDSKLEIKIKAIVPIPGGMSTSSFILRCFVVVMDKVDVSEVSFVK